MASLVPTVAPASELGPGGLAPRDVTMMRLTEAWLDRQGSPHTRTNYERDLRYWLGWCQAHGMHPLDARVNHVDKWLAMQRDHGVRPDAKPSARRSIARRLSAVSSWYSYLLLATAADPEPVIKHNPAALAERPDVDRDDSPTKALSRAEADKMIAAADADGPRTSALIRLLLTNAYRIDSALAALIENLGHDRGHRVLDTVIKGSHAARDPIPPATAAAIDAYLATRGNPAKGYIFVTRTGRRLDEPYAYRLVKRIAKTAGVNLDVSPHGLRSTAITETLDATNGNLRAAQDLAHHADARTTRVYDKGRGKLDGHAAYVLGTRYGARHDG